MVRKGAVPELPVETVVGDLRDRASLDRAVQGCGAVFHAAADYRLWAPQPQELFDSNVTGTLNLLDAARDARVDRVVYTSTVGCIGLDGDKAGTEDAPTRIEDMKGAYKRSKYLAELEIINFAHTGFPVVIVNPTAPVGDHDAKPTPTGQIVVDFLKGRMPAFVDTGLNIVDARDVAEGHYLALERGKSAERYILGSENLTLEQILNRLETISGRPAPKLQLPYGVAYAAGWFSERWAAVTGKPPRVPLDGVRMSARRMWVSHAKASEKLGYQPRPALEALRAAVDWFRANAYV